MPPTPQHIQRVYFALLLINTLAASMIWGINTIFLLDAGLSNTQAFLANAFSTVGLVLFEVPTGMVADIKGRRTSYLLGTIILGLTTLMYVGVWYIHGAFWMWAVSSILLGLGFTFFSGATEAWLVDALKFSKYEGTMDAVFAKGQMVSGFAMLVGSVGGGFIAQITNLGIPYVLRGVFLFLNFVLAFIFMKDWGFTPVKSKHFGREIKELFHVSFNYGLGNPAVRWIMVAGPLSSGVGYYAFYAMQPFLLQLYHNDKAYGIAGLAAAIVAGAQIIGGMTVQYAHKFFHKRTSLLIAGDILATLMLLLIGFTTNFWIAIALLSIWGLVFAATMPVRQSYLNALIPSQQRATVLSFDNMLSSGGGVVIQPMLGRAADIWSYGTSFMVGAVFQSIAIPFTFLAKREKVLEDTI